MAQSTTTASSIEVNGHIALAMIKGMAGIDKRYRHVLEEYGLDNPNTESWYSLDAVLDMFKEIAAASEPFVISDMGARVGYDTEFPSGISSIEKAFAHANALFSAGHRGKGNSGEDTGSYSFEQTSDNSGTVTSTTPYPCDFDLGFIDAVARRFRPKDSWDATVVHDNSVPCRNRGGDCCTYIVQW